MSTLNLGIDPGHNCGVDRGAEYKGLTEDSVVLEVAKSLRVLAERAGLETTWCLPLVKASSVLQSLQERVGIANSKQVDLYVSIHANRAEPTASARGVEVYATSKEGKVIAQRILSQLSALGFKNRGIKTALSNGKPPYVVSKTIAAAVLIELFFLDSEADVIKFKQVGVERLAQAILAGISSKVVTPKQTAIKSEQTVMDFILSGRGGTNGVKGLSDRIIARMGTQKLVKVIEPNLIATPTCDPYFQPHVAEALIKLLRSRPNRQMVVNSAYRSCIRQEVLWQYYRRGLDGITLAAKPGTGSHEDGCAIDINNYKEWHADLIAAGWDYLGPKDPVHYSLPSRIRLASESLKAFQTIYNETFPSAPIKVDGLWGPTTERAMLAMPISISIPYKRSLSKGVTGKDVYTLAARLRALGFYQGSIETELFNDRVELAVIAYQKSIGLTADGVAGPMTITRLFENLPSSFALVTGS